MAPDGTSLHMPKQTYLIDKQWKFPTTGDAYRCRRTQTNPLQMLIPWKKDDGGDTERATHGDPRNGRRTRGRKDCLFRACGVADNSGISRENFPMRVPHSRCLRLRFVLARGTPSRSPGPAPLVDHGTTAPGRWRSREAVVPCEYRTRRSGTRTRREQETCIAAAGPAKMGSRREEAVEAVVPRPACKSGPDRDRRSDVGEAARRAAIPHGRVSVPPRSPARPWDDGGGIEGGWQEGL